jgi:hypothetical protein
MEKDTKEILICLGIVFAISVGFSKARDRYTEVSTRDQFQQSSPAEQLSLIKNNNALMICTDRNTGETYTPEIITEGSINPDQLDVAGCIIKARDVRDNWFQVSPPMK